MEGSPVYTMSIQVSELQKKVSDLTFLHNILQTKISHLEDLLTHKITELVNTLINPPELEAVGDTFDSLTENDTSSEQVLQK
jgi:hypothetical protein